VDAVISSYKAIRDLAPEVFESGKPLTLIGNGGTKGSATMLLGVAACYLYAGPDSSPARVAEAAKALNENTERNFSGPVKRGYLARFVRAYFESDKCNKHEGIPVGLIKTLSSSAFAVTKPDATAVQDEPVASPAQVDEPGLFTTPEERSMETVPANPDAVILRPEATAAPKVAAKKGKKNESTASAVLVDEMA
jgi:hypothetical protein